MASTGLQQQEHAEIDDNVLVPTKVHIRGLDVLTTEDIKSYLSEHFGPADRIEWINDTSANLVFNSTSTAQDALASLSAIEIADPTQLPILECVPAKSYTAKPEVELQVRFALSSDKKKAGASSRSRFYLLHPEYDPEERFRREHTNRAKYRDRDGASGRRRRDMERRRLSQEDIIFDESFYDDKEPEETTRPSHGRSQTKELFPGRRRGDRLRSRSASPSIADDRSNRNRARALQVKQQLITREDRRELFPSKISTSSTKLAQLDQLEAATKATSLDNTAADHSLHIRGIASQGGPSAGFTIKGTSTVKVKELFPNKFDGGVGNDLFADKLEGRNRRRQKAEDLFH